MLGLGGYETAWTMLHRFRRSMVRPDRERLKGVVEVDETYLSISDRDVPKTEERRKRLKSRTHQVLVVMAVELLSPRASAESGCAASTTTLPNRWCRSCRQASNLAPKYAPTAQPPTWDCMTWATTTSAPSCWAPMCLRMWRWPACTGWVAALIKRWILGTHHGSVQPAYLDANLDEFVFRFKRRTSASRGILFCRLLRQSVITDPGHLQSLVRPLPKTAKQV